MTAEHDVGGSEERLPMPLKRMLSLYPPAVGRMSSVAVGRRRLRLCRWLDQPSHSDRVGELVAQQLGQRLRSWSTLTSHGSAATYRIWLVGGAASSTECILKACHSISAASAPVLYRRLSVLRSAATPRLWFDAKCEGTTLLFFRPVDLSGFYPQTRDEIKCTLRNLRLELQLGGAGLVSGGHLVDRSARTLPTYIATLGEVCLAWPLEPGAVSSRLCRWAGAERTEFARFSGFDRLKTVAWYCERAAEVIEDLGPPGRALCHPDPSPGNFLRQADGTAMTLDWDDAWVADVGCDEALVIQDQLPAADAALWRLRQSRRACSRQDEERRGNLQAARRVAAVVGKLGSIVDCLVSTGRCREVPGYVAAWLLRNRSFLVA